MNNKDTFIQAGLRATEAIQWDGVDLQCDINDPDTVTACYGFLREFAVLVGYPRLFEVK